LGAGRDGDAGGGVHLYTASLRPNILDGGLPDAILPAIAAPASQPAAPLDLDAPTSGCVAAIFARSSAGVPMTSSNPGRSQIDIRRDVL
jgi:hypothetical protein